MAIYLNYESQSIQTKNSPEIRVKELDIHGVKRRLDTAIEKIKNSNKIRNKNKNKMLKFCDNCFAKELSNSHVEKHVQILYKSALSLNKPSEKADKDNIIRCTSEKPKKILKNHHETTNKTP
jgi:hypothetical protein